MVMGVSLLPDAPGREPFIVDEAAIAREFEHEMDRAIKKGEVPTGQALMKQAISVDGRTVAVSPVKAPRSFSYERAKDSIGVVSSLFKCGKCDSWHRGGVSTAWVASADGLIVTNLHVVTSSADKSALGLWLPDGRTYPVLEVVAADALQDIAVLRVKASGLKPLPLGSVPEVGDSVRVISHPESRYYVYTQGVVSRFYRTTYNSTIMNDALKGMLAAETTHSTAASGGPGAESVPGACEGGKVPADKGPERRQMWMNITAEYAKGSSGAPVFDSRGRVVGMVSSTQSIYTGASFRPENPAASRPGVFQMCLRNCVPLDSLKAVLRGR